MKALTVSMQRYINAIYELSPGNEGARISDIAFKIGVSKASACIAARKLEENGLIYRDGWRLVYLSDEGRQQAVLMLNKYEIIRKFLIETLKMEQSAAKKDARAMERTVSIHTICAICRFNGKGRSDNRCEKSCAVYQPLP